MDTDEWLQILAHHPIFSEPNPPRNNNSGFGLVAAKAKAKHAFARERVVVRGTDLFVAVGAEVRWINLKACKDAYVLFESKRVGLKSGLDKVRSPARHATSKQEAVKSVPWFKLGCEALSFEVLKLVCNGTGKLLVAIGTHQVAVVVLPAPGAAGMALGGTGGGAFDLARHEAFHEDDNDQDKNQGVRVDCRSMIIGTMPGVSPDSAQSTKGTRRRSSAGLSASTNWSVRTRVVDVAWHPLSTNGSHLLVLYANGTVKMFDVSADADIPEQTVSLFSSLSMSAGFAMNQAVSLCIGSPGSVGWSRATVYVLTNTGQLYSLCPVLPRQCRLERDWLTDLLETAELDVREWKAEEYETGETVNTPPELADARAAAKWLAQMLELDKFKGSGVSGELMYLTLPVSLSQPAVAQGPYLFQPEPVPMCPSGYDSDSSGDLGADCGCDADDACDLLYLESASGVGLVVISFCDGHIEVFADLEPVIARWIEPSRGVHPRDLPVLATLASVNLVMQPLTSGGGAEHTLATRHESKSRQKGTVTLLADPLSPTVFYALHSHGVHRVDMGKWARLLDKAVGLASDTGRSAALEQLLFVLDGRHHSGAASDGRGALARSCVMCVVHTNPCASQEAMPVVGAVVVEDIYLSYSLLALVAPCQLVGVPLPLLGDSVDNDRDGAAGIADGGEGDGNVSNGESGADGQSSHPRRIDLSLGPKDVIYVPRLPKDGYDVPAILDNGRAAAVRQPRFVMGEAGRASESGKFTEEKLKLLGQVVGQLRDQLASVVSAHSDMRTHLDLQVQEHRRQHDKLTAISNGFSRHFEQMKVSQSRMDAMRDNGQRLALRVDHVLRQLLSFYHPAMTPSEREFDRSVRELSSCLNGPGGLGQLIDNQQDQVKELQELYNYETCDSADTRKAGKVHQSPPSHRFTSGTLGLLEQVLEQEKYNVQKMRERITNLQERLDGIGIGDSSGAAS
ncbi:hypothetical protein GGI20_000878 [Coemansia sp. BCRC 34301]|nr:hypothetical protein GGI20_000878 [Coemansia sp. BCRC 34301]